MTQARSGCWDTFFATLTESNLSSSTCMAPEVSSYSSKDVGVCWIIRFTPIWQMAVLHLVFCDMPTDSPSPYTMYPQMTPCICTFPHYVLITLWYVLLIWVFYMYVPFSFRVKAFHHVVIPCVIIESAISCDNMPSMILILFPPTDYLAHYENAHVHGGGFCGQKVPLSCWFIPVMVCSYEFWVRWGHMTTYSMVSISANAEECEKSVWLMEKNDVAKEISPSQLSIQAEFGEVWPG